MRSTYNMNNDGKNATNATTTTTTTSTTTLFDQPLLRQAHEPKIVRLNRIFASSSEALSPPPFCDSDVTRPEVIARRLSSDGSQTSATRPLFTSACGNQSTGLKLFSLQPKPDIATIAGNSITSGFTQAVTQSPGNLLPANIRLRQRLKEDNGGESQNDRSVQSPTVAFFDTPSTVVAPAADAVLLMPRHEPEVPTTSLTGDGLAATVSVSGDSAISADRLLPPTSAASTALASMSTRNRSKWGKLRQTVKATTMFAAAATSSEDERPTPAIISGGGAGGKSKKAHDGGRRDSFLERISTRQAGGAAAVSSTSTYLLHQTSSTQGRDSEHDGRVASGAKSEHMVPLLTTATGSSNVSGSASIRRRQSSLFSGIGRRLYVIDPDGTFVFAWLACLTAAVLYNLWTCIAREAFPELREGEVLGPAWIAADVVADMVYLVDVVVQMRTGYLEGGLVVLDPRRLAKRYFRSRNFVLDVIGLIPLDFVQLRVGIHPLVRFPRFVKAYRLYRFVYMVETRTIYPNLWRVANLSHVLFLGCHWFAAFYFLISKAHGFRGQWGYPEPIGYRAGVAQKYLRSLHWSTLTLTTIGDLNPPETNWEYLFTIVSYLIGVFVFATIVGQVGNVITNRNASRQEFERHLDGAKAYMRNHNVPRQMQQRVQRWYDYAWSRGRINGGGDINSLGLLPDKLKTELALHVNLETLRKVTIFHECEPEFLHDLVLKMKAYIFTPGDLICRKGEVAREMFIIADGLVEVISETGEVLTQMSAGNFFGEIGILNLDGGINRRTADVRSVGYSELFVLSRDDVLTALKDHPEAEVLIKEYGRKRLQQLDEHKRRRLLAAQATTANVEKGGAVRKMVSSSTGLLKGVVEFGLAVSAVAQSQQQQQQPPPPPQHQQQHQMEKGVKQPAMSTNAATAAAVDTSDVDASSSATAAVGKYSAAVSPINTTAEEAANCSKKSTPRRRLTWLKGHIQTAADNEGSEFGDEQMASAGNPILQNGWPSKNWATTISDTVTVNEQSREDDDTTTTPSENNVDSSPSAQCSGVGNINAAMTLSTEDDLAKLNDAGDIVIPTGHIMNTDLTGLLNFDEEVETAIRNICQRGRRWTTTSLTSSEIPKRSETDDHGPKQLESGTGSVSGSKFGPRHAHHRNSVPSAQQGDGRHQFRPLTSTAATDEIIKIDDFCSADAPAAAAAAAGFLPFTTSPIKAPLQCVVDVVDVGSREGRKSLQRLDEVGGGFDADDKHDESLLNKTAAEEEFSDRDLLGDIRLFTDAHVDLKIACSSNTEGESAKLSDEIGRVVATFVRQRMMSRQALYEGYISRLEEENARKQELINQLKLALGQPVDE